MPDMTGGSGSNGKSGTTGLHPTSPGITWHHLASPGITRHAPAPVASPGRLWHLWHHLASPGITGGNGCNDSSKAMADGW